MLAEALTVNINLWTLAKTAPVAALILMGIIHRKKLWANRKSLATALLAACFLVPGVAGTMKWKLAAAEQAKNDLSLALPGPWLNLYQEASKVASPEARKIIIEKFCTSGASGLPSLSPHGLALLVSLVETEDHESDGRMAAVSNAAGSFIAIPMPAETQLANAK